jgi:PAS domain S-box-containing protein
MALVAVTALYLLIFIWAAVAYLRRRDPLLRDVMLIFGSVGMLFALGVLRLTVGSPPRMVNGLIMAVLLGQPFFTLRLVSRLRRVPAWVIWGAFAGWIGSAVLVIALPRPLPDRVVWPVVTLFFLVEAVAAVLLGVDARHRGGAARTRLWCAAVGTLIFGATLLFAAADVAVLARWVAVVSALMYLLAFLPPHRLRRSWSWGAAYVLMRSLLDAPPAEPAERIWQRYCGCARQALGADAVVVLLPGPGDTVQLISGPDVDLDLDGQTYRMADIRRLQTGSMTIDALAGWTDPPPVAAGLARISGTRFLNAAPLPGAGGALVLLHRYRTLFADDDVELFAELGSQAAALAERAAMLTERQRLAVIVESSADAIMSKALDGTITSWNAGAERLYGYRVGEVLGRDAAMLFPPEHRAVEAELLARVGRGEHIDQFEAQNCTRDGSPVTVSLTSSLITDANGHPTGVACIARDITERLQAQAERDRLAAQADLDATERRLQHTRRLESLGQLAGGVAHDFNNILAVIASYTELLTETLDTPAPDPAELASARADLGQIARATERATRLTKQLLAFGRREITQAQVLSINHVVGDVEQMLRRTLGEHIHLITDLDRDLWPVFVDPAQFEQVLVNLAVNSRDAMPGGGTLSIDTSNTEPDEDDLADSPALEPGRYVRLRFSDTGNGMPPEVAERAFEPFFTTKPHGAGTGLGLATVYGITSAAGGHVRVYSEPGIGTTITLVLPATDAPVTDTETPAEAVTTQATVAAEATVLLVEDEEALRVATSRILTRAGYEVLVADGGAAALRLAQHHPGPIDLLLTDVMMPAMMGNEVAARVHALRPGVPVLYMSGYAQPVLTENGTLQEGVIIIEKPFTRRDLLDRVHARLRHGAPAGSTAAPPG